MKAAFAALAACAMCLPQAVAAQAEVALDTGRIDRMLGSFVAEGRTVGLLTGGIPRSFANWFEAPVRDHGLQELQGKLGTT